MQLPADLVRTCNRVVVLKVASVVWGTVPMPAKGEKARCWRSKAWIAETAGVRGQAVKEASAWLVRHGFVERQRIHPGHSDWILLRLGDGYPKDGGTNARTPAVRASVPPGDGGTDARTPAIRPDVPQRYDHDDRSGTRPRTQEGDGGDYRLQEVTNPQRPPTGGRAVSSPTSPKPRKRRSRSWQVEAGEDALIRRVLAALADARAAQGWPPMRLRPTTRLRQDQHGSLVQRLRELREDGEDDPEALLVAIMKAKVHEHASRDGRHGEGAYAVPTSICARDWWASNLAGGRAWLERGSSSSKREPAEWRPPEFGEYEAVDDDVLEESMRRFHGPSE